MEHKMLKRLVRLERKYEKAKGGIEKARIVKAIRNTLVKMAKKGYEIPTELEGI
jgi:hypothetical protein